MIVLKKSLNNRVTLLPALLALAGLFAAPAIAQFDSGSTGADGVYAPPADDVITLNADGIYHYESVNIPSGVTVTFIPNADNTPVTWLVQDTCLIDGTVSLNGHDAPGRNPGAGGPGGFGGGGGSPWNVTQDPGPGFGPGGGLVETGLNKNGGAGSYGTLGARSGNNTYLHPPGNVYGRTLWLPLVGGSGGGGSGQAGQGGGGGGGGGAILIVATTSITISGVVRAIGGASFDFDGIDTTSSLDDGGDGSGGAIRLVSPVISGIGNVNTRGGRNAVGPAFNTGGEGRVRIEGDNTNLTGTITGAQTFSRSPGILILPAGTLPELTITSVAGVTVPASPQGNLTSPDITIPPATINPVTILVNATQLDLDTAVTVEARPEAGPVVSGVAPAVGTVDASTATVSLDLPAGAGLLQAIAVNGVAKKQVTAATSYRDTGLAPNGERFEKVEVVSVLGGAAQYAYITTSGARYLLSTGD